MLNEELNNAESRDLLLAIDKMREILHAEKITLPEIVVVGDQSVGKSSVLEAISGIQLPRAQNICTRCPLELRMKTSHDREYATIRSVDSNEAKRIDDLSQIANEVSRLTAEIAGGGCNVSSKPIYLTVYKRDIPYDLTLIDLPGITRNPLPGQAKDIHEQLLTLINTYIEPSTAIVLHVIPASTDFTTSESMKLAKQFDPQCVRQLIAASKIDKYDKGIAEKLQGFGAGAMELKLGCVAILNRNQQEIDENISFEEMKQRERQFFLTHREAFQHLPDDLKGSDQLARRLASIQRDRIRSTFPKVLQQLKKQIAEKKAELKKLPLAMNTEQECWVKFQAMLSAYRESIHDKVKGDYDQAAVTITTLLPTTYADSKKEVAYDLVIDSTSSGLMQDSQPKCSHDDRLAYHFHNYQREFQVKLYEKFSNFLSGDYHKQALQAVDEAAGVSLPNFPSYQIIVRLFRQELDRLPDCCFAFVDSLHRYMSKSLLRLFERAFKVDYPRLIERLKDIVKKKLEEAEEAARERVQETLDMERRVFTLNHYYMKTVKEVKDNDKKNKDEREAAVAAAKSSASSTLKATGVTSPTTFNSSISYAQLSNEALAAVDIQIALHAYSEVVQKRMTDTVSQTCYHQFITHCALIIDQELAASIPSSELVRHMREPHEQSTLRTKLTRSIQACEEALRLGQAHL